LSGDHADKFEIFNDNGVLKLLLKEALDFEGGTSEGDSAYYEVTVRVADDASPTGFVERPVRVYVQDVPEPENTAPEIEGAADSQIQDVKLAKPFASMTVFDNEDATDTDMTVTITFAMADGAFADLSVAAGYDVVADLTDDGTTYTLVLTGKAHNLSSVLQLLEFDPENYNGDAPAGWARDTVFTVKLQDSAGGSSQAHVTLHVTANRAPTAITLSNDTVPEDWGATMEVGVLGAVDPNGDTEFTFSLANPADPRASSSSSSRVR
jgi:hypothetical protein